jgi:signal transduction histidine kinase
MQLATRKSWLHAAGLLATALIALALIGAALRGSWEDHRKAQFDQLSALSRAFTAHVGTVLNAAADDLRLLAGEIANEPALLASQERLARRLTLVRTTRDRSAEYAVIGRDGGVVAGDVVLAEAAAIIAAHRDQASDELKVVRAAQRADEGAPGLLLSTVLRDRRGEVLGAVAARLRPHDLSALFGEIVVLAGTGSKPRRVDGILLARTPDPSAAGDGWLGRSRLRDLALGGALEGSTSELSAPDGEVVISHFVALPGLPIVPVITMPQAELWRSWLRANTGPIVSYMVLLAMLLAGQAAFLARLRRDARAQAAAHALAAREAESAQRGLAVTEARFRDGIESMAEGFVMWDAQDRLLMWNQRAHGMLSFVSGGWRVGDGFRTVIDAAATALMPDAEPQARERWVAAALAAHAERAGLEFVTPDGRIIEALDRPMSDGGTITIYRDVSEERGLMRRLAESEARFWDGIESMGEGFVLCDPQDRLFAWNDRATVLKPEMRAAAEVGKPFEVFTREMLRLAHPALDEDELAARVAERMRWRGELGVARHVEWPGGRFLRVTENRTTEGGIVTIIHDATAELRAQADLERALIAEREMNAQQRRFVSMASHEFRTPLAVIDGATQRLMAKLPAVDADADRRLARIRGAVSRMTELIERTLSSARLDEGRIEFLPKPIDIAATLRDVAERQRQLSPHFTIALPGLAPSVMIEGDAKLLDQVFTNLLTNAVKYSGRSRFVEITLAATPDVVRVEVRDFGLGVPADEMPQLFTRFFRARTSVGIPGTGIGLHVVREFVHMHGGRIEVASEIDAGSTFAVILPLRQRPAVGARNAA